jgi:hypothetical protein
MRKNITVLGKNGSLLSQNAYKELFLLAEGQSTLTLSKKSNMFQKYRTHLCICNQCKDMGSSACVQRLYGYRK